MKYSKILYTLASLLVAAKASDVVQLTTEEFDDFVSENSVVMAEFYAPWCGHCQALAPEYEQAATILKEKNLMIAKIDCTEEEKLCADQKIQGYPTLKVFHGLDKVGQYQGPRKADAIVSYMIRQSMPAVSPVTAENIDEFKGTDNFVAIGFFDDKKSNTTFQNLADSLRDKYVFGASSDAKLAKELGVSKLPAVVVFKNFDDGKAIYDSSDKNFKFTQKNLKSFVALESFPVIGEIGPGTFSEYATADVPLMYIFVDNAEDREELSEIARSYHPQLKGKAHIGLLDASMYGGHAPNVNLREEWPAVAIQDFEKGLKYVHPQDQKITKKSFSKFIEDYVSGKLDPSVKSEKVPAPEEQGPVYTVVGKNYDELVLDDDKDVLVEFYAPWCGHCKNLAPTYEELGALYFNNADLKNKVVVAKVDHTLNDVPDEIQGYPTIKLFKAGDKKNPVEFTGSRTLEGLVEFIKEEGTHKADGLAGKAAEKRDVKEDEKEEKTAEHEEL
ncbi:protein disulfide-isomerase [Trichomonascus vanleenenianus]|uniref:protein disulfide isomerase PDI1 n=1 Tax=Trichomonascus vanleenenianus TaxID=2268995 RepID=UPI003ECB1B14